LYALYDLVDQKLLNIEGFFGLFFLFLKLAIQNTIIGLFDFLSVSEEIVKQYHSSEINEVWEFFSIFWVYWTFCSKIFYIEFVVQYPFRKIK